MWTADNRPRYNRDGQLRGSERPDRCGMGSHLRAADPAGQALLAAGQTASDDLREVINGVMYILSTGCQWRALPKDLPPRSTVHD